eukprot:CAMPEP_0203674946 /NCGR_PEP_ID=MMETSP0090-20130426/18079_1 /ASSEMBLY_ACC=CAM_ASM_001088 /TAXON_ID=426623 /ORGANISM="Chaetoceros affinis, Strain CCMP159" /LENGTH=646 /DNA_ID=CAMNT_0050540965 /DNA_START=37 /DNA_END=1977 /DNA_ORIENTATION=-
MPSPSTNTQTQTDNNKKNGRLLRLFRSKSNKSNEITHSDESNESDNDNNNANNRRSRRGSDHDHDQFTKDGRKKGSRRRCISPEVRRKIPSRRRNSNAKSSVATAPDVIESDMARKPGSIKSAPTVSVPSFGVGDREPPIRDLGNIQRYRGSSWAERHKHSSMVAINENDGFLQKNGREGGLGPDVENFNGDYKYHGNKSVGARTCQSLDSEQLLLRRKSERLKSNVKIPHGEITIVITDIEGSTSLWEEDPIAMEKALELHDYIIRKCYTNQSGYEITTEGDSFCLAFHHPLDAFSFALQAQVDLYNARWSERILQLKSAKLDKDNTMRGLRVRMGLHHGKTVSYEHEMTHRTYYRGDAVTIAKAVQNTAHGGQIITTVETWRAVSGMAERYLGSPQVLDCGEHELLDCDLQGNDNALKTQKLMQLVPKKFAFDYFTWRGTKGKNHLIRKEGRRFPPLKTARMISTGFHGAPYKNDEVVMVFVYTVEMVEDLNEDSKAKNSGLLSNIIRTNLLSCRPHGYECQETNGQWMLAFHTLNSAITFGVKTTSKLENAPLNVKVGIQKGSFLSQGPHKVTGRADYFGQVVNRAARVAVSCVPGQVILGVPDDEEYEIPSSKMFWLSYLRKEKFRGMSVTSTLYDCFLQAG